MNLLLVFGLSLGLFILANRYYGRWVGRTLGENDAEPTPAMIKADRTDFVPTKPHILFAHHFATIAGAGPIVGPTVALLYGFIPAWMWVVLGGIFFGAVHDFTALLVSIKEGGRSLAEVTRRTLGRGGFLLFIGFTLAMLYLVCSAFLNAAVISLTSQWPLERLGLDPSQTLLRTKVNPLTGVEEGVIGGIASTSAIIITLFAPLLGWGIRRGWISTVSAYIIAALIAFVSVIIGLRWPVAIEPHIWMIILSVYCLFAAGLPVWVILQPRDFTNVQILYGGMALLIIGTLTGGFGGTSITYPAFNVTEGVSRLGFIWPMMFVTIACGAISGFHALVAGGTTSKQVIRQRDARRIGYGAMLLESVLALLVIIALAVGLNYSEYLLVVWPEVGMGKSNPILAFSLAVGNLTHRIVGLPIYIGTLFGIMMVEGFILTTLDSAVRFARYLWEELWQVIWPGAPAVVKHPWFNGLLAVAGMWALAAGNSFNALWPIFGSANQLLAALTLMTVTLWLMVRGRPSWFTALPAAFMVVTTIVSLILLLVNQYIPKGNRVLMVADLALLGLATALAYMTIAKAAPLLRVRPVEV